MAAAAAAATHGRAVERCSGDGGDGMARALGRSESLSGASLQAQRQQSGSRVCDQAAGGGWGESASRLSVRGQCVVVMIDGYSCTRAERRSVPQLLPPSRLRRCLDRAAHRWGAVRAEGGECCGLRPRWCAAGRIAGLPSLGHRAVTIQVRYRAVAVQGPQRSGACFPLRASEAQGAGAMSMGRHGDGRRAAARSATSLLRK